jgi:hypothetical protein
MNLLPHSVDVGTGRGGAVSREAKASGVGTATTSGRSMAGSSDERWISACQDALQVKYDRSGGVTLMTRLAGRQADAKGLPGRPFASRESADRALTLLSDDARGE